ncbi:hypothetical protein PFICI_11892 [Pestalotiopsis fici W106-1]|uniref:Uncharacterized protein n=1 Tax=Pestalotiopsis fici (strain W106-1 / CGMCC3.15140) TaxID=1229662 RepID=W3WRL3_PESFW|nr:uncharacterized protein PFICI_11892 [Pestalotiopsis fici W106-1]ETS76505.1 hypothetical protein PFICI_11892 [Pestalotiopsis fici W106-1]
MDQPKSPLENFGKNESIYKTLHERCSKWFVRHVENTAKSSRPSKPETTNFPYMPSPDILLIHLDALRVSLSRVKETSVREIYKEFRRELETRPASRTNGASVGLGLGPESPSSSDNNDRNPTVHGVQYVFLLMGLLSMLYEPSLAPRDGRFDVVLSRPDGDSPRFSRQMKGQTEEVTDSLEVKDHESLSFYQLYASFGRRLPGASTTEQATGSDTITASNIYYSNLRRVGKLRIEWVNDMLHHLDLDERNRTLRVFAYPSFCTLVCLSDPKSTSPLSKLMSHSHINPVSQAEDGEEKGRHQFFDDYCREMLISFGIIFAQESGSRRAVRTEARSNWLRRWRADEKENTMGLSWAMIRQADEIIWELCTRSWEENPLFNYLQSPPTRSNYSTQADFPFLGQKLIRLQDYMNVQSPNDFRTLLFDRRDPLRFWTFVTAIGFGLASLALNTVTIALAAAQLRQDASNTSGSNLTAGS